MDKSVAICWLKRDLRLLDNVALNEALKSHSTVVATFILEPSFISAPETSFVHVNAVFQALTDLRAQLANRNAGLLLLYGEIVDVLDEPHSQLPFGYIYAHEEIGNNRTYKRDLAVYKWSQANGVTFREFQQTGVVRRLNNRDEWTHKWRNFYYKPALDYPSAKQFAKMKIPHIWTESSDQFELSIKQYISKESYDELRSLDLQHTSESRALEDLRDFFFNRGIGYSGGISSPNTALTAGSRLSAHLAYGTISARYVYQRLNERVAALKESGDPTAKKWITSLVSFRSRLHWRDHFIQRLESEPGMEFAPLNPSYKDLGYTNIPERIAAFFAGQTGYPLIDAVVRCLIQTRFINFRMRSMVVSFACHALHISWRVLDAPLARLFLDYEPGIHLSQLQMQAGVVGINTLRTYNPTKQIIDQDPDCVFIKKWMPELKDYTPAEIIDHVNFPLSGYIEPIIDWKSSVAQMRKMIYDIRRLPESKEIAKLVYEKHGSRKKNTMRKRPSKSITKPKNQVSLTLFD